MALIYILAIFTSVRAASSKGRLPAEDGGVDG